MGLEKDTTAFQRPGNKPNRNDDPMGNRYNPLNSLQKIEWDAAQTGQQRTTAVSMDF
jgi:hypothetical protein